MLEEKHHTIWWTPCAAHCLDLMLEDIGKIEWVKNTVEQGKSIKRYSYNHIWVLTLMRKNIGGKELGYHTFCNEFSYIAIYDRPKSQPEEDVLL
jgi:hypothetical protein